MKKKISLIHAAAVYLMVCLTPAAAEDLPGIDHLPWYVKSYLTGIWSTDKDFDPDSGQTGGFSWGIDRFNPESYLIFDPDARPPMMLMGSAEWSSWSVLKSFAEQGENRYLFVFRDVGPRQDEDSSVIITLNPGGPIELEANDRVYNYYKVSGPGPKEFVEDDESTAAVWDGCDYYFRGPVPTGDLTAEDFAVIYPEAGGRVYFGQRMQEVFDSFMWDPRFAAEYHYKDMDVYAADDRVVRILLSRESPFRTRRGIGIGASSAEVVQRYGGQPGKSEYSYYLSGPEVRRTWILGFNLTNDRVERIIMNIAAP